LTVGMDLRRDTPPYHPENPSYPSNPSATDSKRADRLAAIPTTCPRPEAGRRRPADRLGSDRGQVREGTNAETGPCLGADRLDSADGFLRIRDVGMGPPLSPEKPSDPVLLFALASKARTVRRTAGTYCPRAAEANPGVSADSMDGTDGSVKDKGPAGNGRTAECPYLTENLHFLHHFHHRIQEGGEGSGRFRKPSPGF